MSGLITRRAALATAGSAGLALGARPALAQAAPDLGALEALITRAMTTFEQPGLSVAVVRDGQTLMARGFGVRRLGAPETVDEATLFAIASNSKAYTAASLALLVEEGKIGWDEPVVRYLPEFAMYDPYVTANMTVRDLLVHRSGLALGAGDLMIWPSTLHTRADVVHGLRYLKPARGFRSGYAYDNVLYVVAGELVTRVSGVLWEDFVEQRIFRPLGMTDSVAAFSRLAGKTNVAAAHARISGPVRGVGPITPIKSDDFDNASPAGGLQMSARDAARWLRVQLALGALPGGGRLWSEQTGREMWKGQTIIFEGRGPTAENPTGANFGLYALGWQAEDYRGRKLVWHSGAVSGQISFTILIPSLNFGACVWSNAEERGVLRSLRNGILDWAMGFSDIDWVADSQKRIAASSQRDTDALPKRPAPARAPSLPLKAYAGTYRDPWYGTITITEARGKLALKFDKTPSMHGALEPWDGEVFKTRFVDRNIEDALVTFETDGKAVTRITMKAYSPSADFSFDYHDLDFKPA
jgi:CubicO group peptidase (beta-lactamase class C family)